MDKFFDSLDELQPPVKQETLPTCCEQYTNHQVHEGMITCKQCGNTVTNIVEGAEWRFYGASDSKSSDPTRCGMPVNQLLPESSVGTSISYRGGNKNMYKIRKYQQWGGMPYKERTLLKVFQEISRVCKINKVPRSTSEIASIFSIQIPVMTRGCKKFQEIMQMNKVDISRIHNTNTITMDDFIDRFCSKLNLSSEDVITIKHISYLCQVYNLVNDNTPPSMAAGCIFLYIKEAGLDINKKTIADVSKISEVTINKCFKKLETQSTRLLV
jgi:transcription initiation factor TFIIB